MGKKRRPTYKNTFSSQRSFKLDTVTGQGKMVLVREKSRKSQGILISHVCGNPGRGFELRPGSMTFLACLHKLSLTGS